MSEDAQPGEAPGEQAAPDVAGSLLAALEAGAQLVDEGGFSIDAAQARKKLRDYLLADAHAYVLLLVEAAVLGGAEPVRLQVDGGALELELGPITFEPEELEQLFAAVFVDLGGAEGLERRRRRALQNLAYACSAALRLEPRAIVIDSGEKRLRLTPRRELGELQDRPAPAGPTRVRIDHGMLAAVSSGKPRELELVRERCRFAPTPIYIDEERISGGLADALHVPLAPQDLAFSPRARRVTKIELGGEVVGLAGLRYSGKLPAELTILTNGVLAEQHEFGLERPAAPDFAAIVSLDLPRDLGQNKLLRGPEYDALMRAIWAVHDRIAPENFGAPSSNLELERPLADSDDSADSGVGVGVPVALTLAGAWMAWLADDPSGNRDQALRLFGVSILIFGLVWLIAAFVMSKKQ